MYHTNSQCLTSHIKSVFIFLCLFTTTLAFADQLTPAPYKAIDRFGVNLASGHVNISQTDVSIGGDMGLTHSFSANGSNFSNYTSLMMGYVDRYTGLLYVETHHKADDFVYFVVVRVQADGESVDFRASTTGVYTALIDPGYTLEYISTGTYKMITPTGKEILFKGIVHIKANTSDKYGPYSVGSSSTRGPYPVAAMSEITYPNGFKVTVHKRNTSGTTGINSVNTNTGFQLKYLYEQHDRPIAAHKQGATSNPGITAESYSWSSAFPRHIVGVNNAIDYCTTLLSSTCNFTKSWPTSTYTWPDGMPRAMYIGESVVKVKNSAGATTEYHHKAIDRHVPPDYLTAGEYYQPRLVKFKPGNSSVPTIEYQYANKGTYSSGSSTSAPRWVSAGDAVLNGAKTNGETTGYINQQIYQSFSGSEPSYQGTLLISNNDAPTLRQVRTGGQSQLQFVLSWNKAYSFGPETVTNNGYEYLNDNIRVISDIYTGHNQKFTYDARGNVTQITENDTVTTLASYPATCTNRKTCNQADWIQDPKGNKTYYTYHAQSGQVATVTSPVNIHGIKPQTRNTYVQKYAYYKNASGATVRASTPVWLLNTSKHCANSNYVSGACQGNDEVVETSQYGTKNLFLIGKTVQANGETRRTCFRYDAYGNQIGSTSPKANLSTCAY